MAVELSSRDAGVGSFHVHPGHAFEGFELRDGVLAALCACGATLDVAEPVFTACPECCGAPSCVRCSGTGTVVDHAALAWSLPTT